jgi:hypothetical protein
MPRGDWGVQGDTLQVPAGVLPGWIVTTQIPAELVAFYAIEAATMAMVQLYELSPTSYTYDGLITVGGVPLRVMGGYSGVVTELCRLDRQGLQIYGARGGPTVTLTGTAAIVVRGAALLRIAGSGADTGVIQAQGDGGSGVILRNAAPARWITESDLGRASASPTLATGAPVAVAGTAITLTASANGARFFATAFFDFQWAVAGATTAEGFLFVDGVAESGNAFFEAPATGTPRATVGQQWRGVLTAGAHSLELRASKSVAAGTVQAMATHTTLIAWLAE